MYRILRRDDDYVIVDAHGQEMWLEDQYDGRLYHRETGTNYYADPFSNCVLTFAENEIAIEKWNEEN